MSQSAVGTVYSKVVDHVCDASQVDFEEGGIDQGTLELLKSGWRKKLTDLKVAQLPWDPAPAPVPTQHAPPTTSNNMKQQPQPVPSNGNIAPPPPAANPGLRANDGTRIKPEPGSYPSPVSQANGYPMPPMPQFPPGAMPTGSAQQRAAMNLQQRYGQQAAQQVAQLQQQAGTQRPQGAPAGPYPKMEDQKPLMSNLPSFSPTMSQPPKAPVSSAQTDGAGDAFAEWKAEVARRRELAGQNPGEGDRLLRHHVLEMQQRLEGGGLMLPLEERYSSSNGTKRKIRSLLIDEKDQSSAGPSQLSLPRAQGDAAADDDADGEADEDAINSDLDDPDQGDEDDDNEENTDQVMLCTYDKVQRVKNKWKCTLKDGIVKVGSTDYVFHKGQGEFEW